MGGQHLCGSGGLPVLSVHHGMEKTSTGWGFRVPKFQLSLCFISAKSVSSVSARSPIHGAHTICVCVPVAILDTVLSVASNPHFYSVLLL
jgi:hypothetical protein